MNDVLFSVLVGMTLVMHMSINEIGDNYILLPSLVVPRPAAQT